jgi:hypothetical protein
LLMEKNVQNFTEPSYLPFDERLDKCCPHRWIITIPPNGDANVDANVDVRKLIHSNIKQYSAYLWLLFPCSGHAVAVPPDMVPSLEVQLGDRHEPVVIGEFLCKFVFAPIEMFLLPTKEKETMVGLSEFISESDNITDEYQNFDWRTLLPKDAHQNDDEEMDTTSVPPSPSPSYHQNDEQEVEEPEGNQY